MIFQDASAQVVSNRNTLTPYIFVGSFGTQINSFNLKATKSGILPNDSSLTYQGFVDSLNRSHSTLAGYKAEILGLVIEPSDVLEFQIGLGILTFRQEQQQYLPTEVQSPNGGTMDGPSMHFDYLYSYNYLQLPFQVHYEIYDNIDWTFGASLGAVPSILILNSFNNRQVNQTKYYVEPQNKNEDAIISPFTLDIKPAIWARYNLNNQLGFFLMASYSASLIPTMVYHDGINQTNIYPGIEFGARVRIFKNSF